MERLGKVLAENKAILAESQALLDLVAPEEAPRSVREWLRDATTTALQFLKNALKKSTADQLAVAKLYHPSLDNDVIASGPPPDVEEE